MKKPIKLVHLKWLISREMHGNAKCSWKSFFRLADLIYVSIYTLSNLGDLSHLIGPLSRIIQQYSPPREWNNV